MNATDEFWMQRALALAEQGRGHVEPNPLVGAVVVRDGKEVGVGWHQKFGGPHAEVHALAQAGEAARGATLLVTLEPCCHHGKTPPCTDAIMRAGIARVLAAMEDPFPKVAGKGAEQLRAAGVVVEFGLCNLEARRLNAPYLKLLTTGRPYVHAKWAMSLDGKIATRTGDSQWISNEGSRARVHELRGRMDGILVGIGTALADDPLLTARPPGPRVACRVVLDSHGRLSPSSQLVRTARETPTLIVVSAACEKLPAFPDCEVLPIAPDATGRPDLGCLLDEMGRRRWTNLLVEGGADVLGSFFDADAVDEVHLFVGPKLIGGANSKSPVAGIGMTRIEQCRAWRRDSLKTLGDDVYVRYLKEF